MCSGRRDVPVCAIEAIQGECTLARSAGCALKWGQCVKFLLPMLQGQYRGKPVECRNPVRGDWNCCRQNRRRRQVYYRQKQRECSRAAVDRHMDRYADQCSEVRHFRHTDVLPSEILDDGTLMEMELRSGYGIAYLQACRSVGEIPDGGLNELWHDSLLPRLVAARLAAS